MRRKSVGPTFYAFVILAIGSLLGKLALAGLGHNFDVDSYRITADAVLAGRNLYTSTFGRYNYGPIWAYLLAALRWSEINWLGTSDIQVFHRMITSVLASVDILLAGLLWARFSRNAGLLFLLNPVSLIISGYYAQFDNVAILIGGWGVILLARGAQRERALGAVLVGVSLVTKHVLIFLPMWWLFRADWSRRERWHLAGLAYGVFLSSFLPFLFTAGAAEGILTQVIQYDSFHGSGLLPKIIQFLLPARALDFALRPIPVLHGHKAVFVAAVVLVGYRLRGKPLVEHFLLNLCTLCVCSSALADQYLAIPVMACAIHWRKWLSWWFVMESAAVLIHSPYFFQYQAFPSLRFLLDHSGLEPWNPLVALLILIGVSDPAYLALKELWRERASQMRAFNPSPSVAEGLTVPSGGATAAVSAAEAA